ncbi:hypothetical protein K474DRAFT_1702386 [Panus rudis PR-1116 ss-1]|nr:hypothetical protein K474DRAFT_1702386 [Panus rudis PR-1116 ss-1]
MAVNLKRQKGSTSKSHGLWDWNGTSSQRRRVMRGLVQVITWRRAGGTYIETYKAENDVATQRRLRGIPSTTFVRLVRDQVDFVYRPRLTQSVNPTQTYHLMALYGVCTVVRRYVARNAPHGPLERWIEKRMRLHITWRGQQHYPGLEDTVNEKGDLARVAYHYSPRSRGVHGDAKHRRGDNNRWGRGYAYGGRYNYCHVKYKPAIVYMLCIVRSRAGAGVTAATHEAVLRADERILK